MEIQIKNKLKKRRWMYNNWYLEGICKVLSSTNFVERKQFDTDCSTKRKTKFIMIFKKKIDIYNDI